MFGILLIKEVWMKTVREVYLQMSKKMAGEISIKEFDALGDAISSGYGDCFVLCLKGKNNALRLKPNAYKLINDKKLDIISTKNIGSNRAMIIFNKVV